MGHCPLPLQHLHHPLQHGLHHPPGVVTVGHLQDPHGPDGPPQGDLRHVELVPNGADRDTLAFHMSTAS